MVEPYAETTAALRAGFIGLGNIGAPMARQVLAKAHSLAVCDVRPEATAPFAEAGARVCTSPAEVAGLANVIAVAVLDDAQAEQVVAGPEGLLEGAAPGTVLCITSTVQPQTVLALAEAAHSRGVGLIDAGVAGGASSAETATLVTMAGGSAHDVARAHPLLGCFSKEVIHAGPLCAGMRLKLLKNHLSYLALGIAHESRRLAEATGIDAGVLRHVVAETSLLEQFLHFGLEREGSARLPPDAGADALDHARKFTEMAHKDLDAALALASDHGLALPFGETARAQAGRYFLLPRDRDPDGAD